MKAYIPTVKFTPAQILGVLIVVFCVAAASTTKIVRHDSVQVRATNFVNKLVVTNDATFGSFITLSGETNRLSLASGVLKVDGVGLQTIPTATTELSVSNIVGTGTADFVGFKAGGIDGLTTIYTNQIDGVITQRLSFVGGVLLTNEAIFIE